MRRVAVIGYGVEGRAAVDHWRLAGDKVEVRAAADVPEPPDGVAVRSGPGYLDDLEDFDLLVRSPGVRPELLPETVPVTSVTAEFLDKSPAPVIGVTGTKGKGTTSTVLAAILQESGRRVFLGGNIGTTPLVFLPGLRPDDVVVLELSSFQLMDLRVSPHVAVVLSVTPDHLEWHHDLAEYHLAKQSIAAHQTGDDTVVFDASSDVAAVIAATSPGRHVAVGAVDGFHVEADGVHRGAELVVPVSDVVLKGAHNLTNVAMAVAAAEALTGAHDYDVVRRAVRSVTPLPHRLTEVTTVDGVTYVDDSLSTTPETAIAAMAAYDVPKVLVLGGSTKGVSFAPLAEAVARTRLRAALLVGAEADRIAAALDSAGVHGYERAPGPMTAVVRRAAEVARPGDVVLLSPACASFGDFRNYADRGDQFIAAVRDLDRAAT